MNRMIKRMLLGVVAVLGALVVSFAGVLWWAMSPTQGARIGPYAAPRTALLVVDIQEDFTGPHARKPFRDGDRLVDAANRLIGGADALGMETIYIRNEIANPLLRAMAGGMNAPGASGTEIDERVKQVAGAPTFTKGRSDAFSNPELTAYLRARQVDRLWIVGLDAAHCVKATMQGALNRGYKVTIVTDAIATESGQSLETLERGYSAAGATLATTQALLAASTGRQSSKDDRTDS